MNGIRTIGKRKQRLLGVLGQYLNQLSKAGINPSPVLNMVGVKSASKIADQYSTKGLTGLIGEVVKFGRENNIEMKRSF